MRTLEEYILSNNIIEQQYDFIDRDFIDFFNLQWCINHSQIKEQIYESNIIYGRQIEQVNYKENVLIQNVKQINNMFTKIEQNAYIGQLIGQITKLLNNKKYHSIDEAIKELINTQEYNKYKTLKIFIIHILSNKDLQHKYIKTYKEITHTSLSDEKIISQLEYKFNKFWFTLQKGIYQYIEDKHLIKESVLQLSTKTFIKT